MVERNSFGFVFTPKSGKITSSNLSFPVCLEVLQHYSCRLPYKKTDHLPSTEKVLRVFSLLDPSALTILSMADFFLFFDGNKWISISWPLNLLMPLPEAPWTSLCFGELMLRSLFNVTFSRRFLGPTSLKQPSQHMLYLKWPCLSAYVFTFCLCS